MFQTALPINMSLQLADFNSEKAVNHPGKSSRHDILNDAELYGPFGGSTLRLRFDGPFEGRTVTWDALFTTLTACDDQPPSERNFIDIGAASEHGIRLTVGLNVSCIDAPTVRKAMMMIRQYKRLSRGRHEYGRG